VKYFPAKWAGSQEDNFLEQLMTLYAEDHTKIPPAISGEVDRLTPIECGAHLMHLLGKYLIPSYFHPMTFPRDNVWRLEQLKDMPQKQYQHYLDGQKVIGDFYKYDPKVPIFSDWEMFAALLVKYLQ
jgi:hypothetical protein